MNKDKLKEIKKELDEYLGAEWITDIKDNIKYIKQFKDEQEKVGSTLSTIAENLPKSMVILNVKEELKNYFKDLVTEFDTSIKDFKSSDKQKDIITSLKELQKILKENKNKEELKDVVTELDEQIKGIQDLNKLLTEIKDKDNTVKVENMPVFDTKELQEVVLNTNLDIKEAIENIVNKVQSVKVENDSVNQAIPVKLVSTDNRYYTAKGGGGAGASGLPFSQDITGDNVGYALINSAGRLQVDVLSGGGGGTLKTDGQAIIGADTAGIICGKDGSANAQFITTDTDGHLQVDVLTGGGGGTQYAEDTAHTTGDLGTGALVVRADTPASLCGADGDYSLLIVDANGRLHVLDKNSDDIKTNTDTIAGDTTSLDGKVTKCDTDNVVLVAGTATIGKLGANSGVDIGDVTLNNTNLDVTTALEGRTFKTATVDFTAGQTSQTIIDPTGGTKFVITDIVISASAEGTITLFDETDATGTRLCKLNMTANSSGHIGYSKPYQSATADNKLEYTTGAGMAGSLTVSYYEI